MLATAIWDVSVMTGSIFTCLISCYAKIILWSASWFAELIKENRSPDRDTYSVLDFIILYSEVQYSTVQATVR